MSDGSGTWPIDDGSQVINLVKCEGVEFEMREGKPCVKFKQGSEEGVDNQWLERETGKKKGFIESF